MGQSIKVNSDIAYPPNEGGVNQFGIRFSSALTKKKLKLNFYLNHLKVIRTRELTYSYLKARKSLAI